MDNPETDIDAKTAGLFKEEFENTFADNDYTELKDNEVGFTMRDKYPNKVLKRLKIEGEHDYTPFFNMYLDNKNRPADLPENLIPFNVGVGLSLKDGSYGNIRYILDDSYIKSKIHKPIGLNSRTDFAFNSSDGKFYQKKKDDWSVIGLDKIKDKAFKLHLAEYTNLVGLRARAKILATRILPTSVMEALSSILGALHWIINGTYFDYDPILVALTDEIDNQQIAPQRKNTDDHISFFGYKVKAWTLYTYSLLIIVAYAFIRVTGHIEFIKSVGDFSLVVLAFAIVSIVTYDRLIPGFARVSIKKLNSKAINLKWTGVKLHL